MLRWWLAIAVAACLLGCVFDPSGTGVTVRDASQDGDRDAGPDARPGGGPDATPSATTLAVGDVRLLYAHADSGTLRSVRWRGDTAMWQRESPTPVLGAVRWVIAAMAGAEELAAVVAEDAGVRRLVVLRAIDDGWVIDVEDDGYDAGRAARGFDLAVEDDSGDALLVYANGRARPAYRTRVDGQWSAVLQVPWNDGDGPAPDYNDAPVQWIELEARPGTDEVALGYVDAAGAFVVATWDGGAWAPGSVQQLEDQVPREPGTNAVVNRAFDVGYEAGGGQLLAVWGRAGLTGFGFSVNSGDGWTAPQGVSAQNGEPRYMDVAADPGSERIAVGAYDLGGGTERLGVALWDGALWDQALEIDSQTNDVNDDAAGDMPGAVAWVTSSGDAMCLYADNEDGTVDFALWDEFFGFGIQADGIVTGKTRTQSVRAVTAGTGHVITAFTDDNGLLYAARYDGLFWSFAAAGDPLDTATPTDAVSFDLAVRVR